MNRFNLIPKVKVDYNSSSPNKLSYKFSDNLIEVVNSKVKIIVSNLYDVDFTFSDDLITIKWGDLDEYGFVLEVSVNNFKIFNDWLGVYRLYYKTELKDTFIATNFDDIECSKSISLHNFEIFSNLGYCPRGLTPFNEVFLQIENSILNLNSDFTALSCDHNRDDLTLCSSTVSEVEELMYSYFNSNTKAGDEVLLPLSGGVDSKYILRHLISADANITAATYGVSFIQNLSYEVHRAKKLCTHLGLKHEFINIDGEYNLLDEWYDVMGPSVHCHGMYHQKFYSELRHLNEDHTVFSGVVGDAFSGHHVIDGTAPLESFFLTHGAHAKFLKGSRDQKSSRWLEANLNRSNSVGANLIEMIRLKMVLLRFLVLIPLSQGFRVQAPFLKKEIVLSMLALPQEVWKDRIWQKNILCDWFQIEGGSPAIFRRGNFSKSRGFFEIKKVQNDPLVGLDLNFADEFKLFGNNNFIKLSNLCLKKAKTEQVLLNYLHYYPLRRALHGK